MAKISPISLGGYDKGFYGISFENIVDLLKIFNIFKHSVYFWYFINLIVS